MASDAGRHYKKHKIQPIEYIGGRNYSFILGNIIKYIVRDKGARLLDLKKIAHYIDIELEGKPYEPISVEQFCEANNLSSDEAAIIRGVHLYESTRSKDILEMTKNLVNKMIDEKEDMNDLD